MRSKYMAETSVRGYFSRDRLITRLVVRLFHWIGGGGVVDGSRYAVGEENSESSSFIVETVLALPSLTTGFVKNG